MRRRALTTGQRVTLLIGTGILGAIVIADLQYRAYGGGTVPSVGLPQSTSTYFVVAHPSAVQTVLLPSLAVAVWTGLGLYLMRRPGRGHSSHPSVTP